MIKRLLTFSVDHPATVTAGMAVLSGLLGVLAVLVALNKGLGETIDTDPENMLPHDEPVRVFHREMKSEFGLSDMIVVGVVNESHDAGVFNPDTLGKVHAFAEFAKTLHGGEIGEEDPAAGVIAVDLMALSTVDNIEPAGPGTVAFEWLMPHPPETQEQAEAVRDKAARMPMFLGTLVSDGDLDSAGNPGNPKALALYVPLTDKHLSYRVASRLQEKVASWGESADEFHFTGLPVAEDTFGVEMFKQMAISAPLAMLIIFVLMWYFFRKIALITSPMVVAVVCVVQTMGLLVGTGNTIHIMSSMIPIFIMPIAVLDAIHILSEFFDRYQESRDRRTAILGVMDTLFMPMLYTSLTTAVGFASLALTPIPPVQIFGLFVAFGVLMAWFWTVTFIPASVMFISPDSLENFGLTPEHEAEEAASPMSRALRALGGGTTAHPGRVVAVTFVVAAVAVYGISRIVINDNPIKWFDKDHPIRVADRTLNRHFAGTYMAYLALEALDRPDTVADSLQGLEQAAPAFREKLEQTGVPGATHVTEQVLAKANELAEQHDDRTRFLDALAKYADDMSFADTTPEDHLDAWAEAVPLVGLERQRAAIFKDPAVLEWMAALQDHMLTIRNEDGAELIGKSSSLADVVRTVYRELLGGKPEDYRVPDSRQGVAQTLMQFQNSHRPHDLWHFVAKPDERSGDAGYGRTSLWVQLKSGDNRDMDAVVRQVDAYVQANPPPIALDHRWFGLTYINVIWQEKMVAGMMNAFVGSFLVVLFMMIVLFRSALWGILSMLPLAVTIGAIYGLIGLVGKDYDMPVAVLSSLSLGLAVDYAIHFLARSRDLTRRHGSWRDAVGAVFGEPARAIARNVLVVGVGFLPLLAAPLVPYQTVGFFIAAILITAGVASLFILPALITLLERFLFPSTTGRAFACQCGTCAIAIITVVACVALNVQQFLDVGTNAVAVVSALVCVALIGLCYANSRSQSCRKPISPES